MNKFVLTSLSLCLLACTNKSNPASEEESTGYSDNYYGSSSYDTPTTNDANESMGSDGGVTTTPVEVSHTNEEGYSATMRDNGNGRMEYNDNTGYSVSSVDNGSSIRVTDNEGNTYTVDY